MKIKLKGAKKNHIKIDKMKTNQQNINSDKLYFYETYGIWEDEIDIYSNFIFTMQGFKTFLTFWHFTSKS